MYSEYVIDGKSLKYSKSLSVRDGIEVQFCLIDYNGKAIRKGLYLNYLAQ